MTPTALSRRRLLVAVAGVGAALAGGGVAACSRGSTTTGAVPASGAAAGFPYADRVGREDLALARAAASSAAALAELGRRTARRHPRLRPLVEPLVARHLEHRRSFTPDGERLRHRPAGQVPGSPAAALRVLVDAERRAASSMRTAALAADSGDLACSLASAAACLAQHGWLLAAEAGQRRG